MSSRKLAEARLEELRTAYAILIAQDVLEVFGHITFRCAKNPNIYWLFEAGPPADTHLSSLVAYNLDSEPIDVLAGSEVRHFSERCIHSAIYAKRPDVGAICHHHSPHIMPFAVAGVPLRPVTQTGASMGDLVPVWRSRETFGDTRLLVTDANQANELADTLGSRAMVLMQNHGATVVGQNIKELVFRAVNFCKDAKFLRHSHVIGQPQFLTPGEISHYKTLGTDPVERSWDHWSSLPETRQLLR